MTDVIHNPATDWCSCPPEGDVVCDYRLLADKVIELFNPRDDDGAEVAVCIDALDQAATFIANQPCTCTVGMVQDGEPCLRCAALGRIGDVRAER